MKKWNRKIPAIFLTARDEEQEMLKAFDLGAEDYVVKPFSMKVLLKRIEVAFRRNRGEDAGEQILKCRDLTLYPQRKRQCQGEGDISYGKRVSAPGISDEKSGAGSDQRKYFGACMGN